MILYRAANKPDARRGAHFSPDRDVALAYTNNPGFGGARIYKYDIPIEYHLDVFRRFRGNTSSARIALARALDYDNPEETARAWRDSGLMEIFQILENVRDATRRLAESYDWISFEDDFPSGAETWKYVGDKTLHGILDATPSQRLDAEIKSYLE